MRVTALSGKFLKVKLMNYEICLSSNLLDTEKPQSKMLMLIVSVSTSGCEFKFASYLCQH